MSESFSRAARSAREMARMLLRWLVLALPIGLLCGGIGTAFHLAVEAVTELRGATAGCSGCCPRRALPS